MRGHKNIDMSMYYNLGSAEGMEKVANTFNDKLLAEKQHLTQSSHIFVELMRFSTTFYFYQTLLNQDI